VDRDISREDLDGGATVALVLIDTKQNLLVESDLIRTSSSETTQITAAASMAGRAGMIGTSKSSAKSTRPTPQRRRNESKKLAARSTSLPVLHV